METPVPTQINPTPNGLSNAQRSKDLKNGFPHIADMAKVLPKDGTQLGWIDGNGNALSLTRFNDEILVQRERGPTSRVVLREIQKTAVPQISSSVAATAE